MRSRFTLLTPPEPAEPIYFDPRADAMPASPFMSSKPAAIEDLPGAQRLELVAGYFSLNGFLCVLALVIEVVALAFKGEFHVASPVNSWAFGTTIAVMSWASFHTARLLRHRRRAGAYTALLYFAGTIAAMARGGINAGIALSVIGLLLTASVWKYLE
jgi:hypothetical protein